MTAGGYIFEKKNLAYDANSNGKSVARFALEIHKARCEAFLEAAHRSASLSNDLWKPVQTNESDELTFNLEYEKDTGDIDYYVRDPFDLNSNIDASQMEYPAFYSFFKNMKTNAEYLILTNHGWKNDGTTALYIKPTYLLYYTSSNYRALGESMSHAYAENGFNSHNISSDSFIGTSTTNIMACFSHSSVNTGNSAIQKSSTGLISRRVLSSTSSDLVGYTFQFGYAIKNSHIIALYRRLDNVYWAWGIIGNIVGKFMDGVSDGTAGITNPYDTTEYRITPSTTYVSDVNSLLSFIGSDGTYYEYPNSNVQIKKYYSGHNNSDASPTMRVSTESPSNGIIYRSVLIGSSLSNVSYSSSSIVSPGVDGYGNGCVGYLDTELIRSVSGAVLQSNGITFQGGNFIGMRALADAREGYILGWDPSNESIM